MEHPFVDRNMFEVTEKKFHAEWADKVQKYEIDPFVDVYHMRENVYSMFAPCTHDHGPSWIHLIIGKEKAMLIDTGFGVGNLKGLVDMLTGGKQLVVVNTHADGDHAGGNSQFGTIYCHEYEAPRMLRQMNPEQWDKFNHRGDPVRYRPYFEDSDIIEFKEYDVIACKNHTLFDIGDGQTIELIHLPGHAIGHCGFIDRKNRILFAGDALTSTRLPEGGRPRPGEDHPECAILPGFLKGLQELVPYMTEFDCLFPGHGKLDLEPQIITDAITCVEELLENPDDYNMVQDPDGVNKVKIHGIAYLNFGQIWKSPTERIL